MKIKTYLIIPVIIGSLLSATCMASSADAHRIRIETINNAGSFVPVWTNDCGTAGKWEFKPQVDAGNSYVKVMAPAGDMNCTMTFAIGRKTLNMFLTADVENIPGDQFKWMFTDISASGEDKNTKTSAGLVTTSYQRDAATVIVRVDPAN